MKKLFSAALLGLMGAAASAQANDHIIEKQGLYYLQPGYDVNDVAEFYWRSLNGWSEKPANVAKYFTPQGVFELPYAPVEDFSFFATASKGRENMTHYFTGMSEYLGDLKYADWKGWRKVVTAEPGVFVFEYTSSGKIRQSGGDYNQQFIAIVTINDGQIASAREYWNPYVALRDFGLIRKTQ
jgi:ketosteroid isomerase-like protein